MSERRQADKPFYTVVTHSRINEFSPGDEGVNAFDTEAEAWAHAKLEHAFFGVGVTVFRCEPVRMAPIGKDHLREHPANKNCVEAFMETCGHTVENQEPLIARVRAQIVRLRLLGYDERADDIQRIYIDKSAFPMWPAEVASLEQHLTETYT